MKQNEKAEALSSNGSNTDFNELFTMNNNTPNQNKFQFNSTPTRQSLLESTKLSRLPERKPFVLPELPPTNAVAVVAVCAGCNGRLDRDDAIQQTFNGCRKCIAIYGRLEAAFDEGAKRKKKELLGKFAAEVKR